MSRVKQRRLIMDLLDHIVSLENPGNWSKSGAACDACFSRPQVPMCETSSGIACVSCAETVFQIFALQQEIGAWHYSRFEKSLGQGEDLRWRLTVLHRYDEAVFIAQKQNPPDIGVLHRLLVKNLGHISGHPLDLTVRGWAHRACLKVGKPLLPILFEFEDVKEPWEFCANIILAAGQIGPDDKDVQRLLEKSSLSPSPNVRARVAAAVTWHDSAWAREMFRKLKQDPNPMVREMLTGRTPPISPSYTRPALLFDTSLKAMIDAAYSLNDLKNIYTHYLHGLYDSNKFRVPGNFSLSKLKKPHLVNALAEVIGRDESFDAFLSLLPEGVKQVFNRLTWEGGEHDADGFDKSLDPPITITEKQKRYGKIIDEVILNPLYSVVSARKQEVWEGGYSRINKYYLSLPDDLRKFFKQYLPKPEGYDLKEEESIEKVNFIYEDNDRILGQINLLCSYIAQENLKYSKSGNKILKTSIKQMAGYCNIREFYDDKDKNLDCINTRLIIEFLKGRSPEEALAPPEFLKRMFRNFFNQITASKFQLHHLLTHIKGTHVLSGEYYIGEHEESELRTRASLLNLLRELSPGQWFSAEKLIRFCLYRDMNLDLVNRSIAQNYLAYEKKPNPGERYWRPRHIYIKPSEYDDVIIHPFVKGFMFLLAGFGILDIAYNYPKNERVQIVSAPYLSEFDGLQYVRLTPLGAYVVGLKEEYDVVIKQETANLVLDEKRLLIHMEGTDRLKAMILEKISTRVSENCYKLSYPSFLKECSSRKDILDKIKLFREHVAEKPPRIWENFLDEVINKIDPLISDPSMMVFRLKENPELISMMAQDDVLRKYILKAEKYHILIPKKNLGQVKKRMEEFGYFMDHFK